MRLISTKGLYGLMAVYELYLHRQQSDNSIKLKDISKKLNISSGYLEQLFTMLKKAKIVKSIRGSKGGYILIDNKISIKDILTVLEGEINTTKTSIENPIFHLFFQDCDSKLNKIFDTPISTLDKYKETFSKNIDFTI